MGRKEKKRNGKAMKPEPLGNMERNRKKQWKRKKITKKKEKK